MLLEDKLKTENYCNDENEVNNRNLPAVSPVYTCSYFNKAA